MKLMSRPCAECGITEWHLPGAPRALPGHSIDATKVAAVCNACGHVTTVDQTVVIEAGEAA